MLFVVTYPAGSGEFFDADYYVGTHMPLVREAFGPHGLLKADALLPSDEKPAYTAIALLEFESGGALDAALASDKAQDVFGDVPNFTAIVPVAMRCERR